MTGYHPDHQFLKTMGIQIDEETGRPYIIRKQWRQMLQGFLLQELLLREIMPMKFLLKMADFMVSKLPDQSWKKKKGE